MSVGSEYPFSRLYKIYILIFQGTTQVIMKAILVEDYGAIDSLKTKEAPFPGEQKGQDLLIN